MQELSQQANKFDLSPNIHYLNGAYMSPQLKSVTRVGAESVGKKAKPYEITGSDFFENTELIRAEYSKLISNPDPNRVVLIPSVSYGMATITKNINLQNKEVVIVGEQFPSNVYPWMTATKEQGGRLIIIDPPGIVEHRGNIWNEKILQAIGANTAVVALPQAHWADGTLFDLTAIRKRTLDVGALLIIDGTQTVGAYPIDIDELKPDALICAGYKWLLGPYGLGLAYYGEYFDNANPLEENWINRLNSEDFDGLVAYEESYQNGSLRFEVGEHSSFVLVPMLLEGLKQLNDWRPERIQAYCKSIVHEPIKLLKDEGFWIEDEALRTDHLFGIRHQSMPIDSIKQVFAEKNIFVSYRGDAIRVAPYVHNSVNDLNVLASTLIKNIKQYA